MGETLIEIADSLSNTIPYNGTLITAEERPEVRKRLAQNTADHNASFIYADISDVREEDLQGFNYLAFKENIAIGLAIADKLDIPRDVALRGMQRAAADIGAVVVQQATVQNKTMI